MIKSFKEYIDVLKKYSNRVAIKEKYDGNFFDYYYDDLLKDSYKVANFIKDKKLSNNNIALIGENSYRWLVCFLGIIMSDNVAIPIDKDLPSEVRNPLLEKLNIKQVFASSEFIAFVDINNDDRFITFDELDNKELFNNETFNMQNDADFDKVVCIILTSGTSGYNKAVELTNRNICANLNSIIKLNIVTKEHGNFISILPLYHSYALFCDAIPCLYYGHTFVIDNSIRNYIKNLIEFKPEVHIVVPSLLNFLSKKIDVFGDYRLKIIVGGASVDINTYTKLIDKGFNVYIGYGMSEAAPLISIKTKKDGNPSTNDLFFTNIKIDSKNGKEGEILLKGDNITPGYYGDDESTRNSFTDDGWFKTGDLGYIENNELYFTGRLKNTIILDNGKNVQPEQIEELLYEKIPYIDDIVVCEITINNNPCVGAVVHSSTIDLLSNPDIVINDIKKINRLLEPYQKISGISISNTLLPKNKIMKTLRKSVKDKIKEYKQYIIM